MTHPSRITNKRILYTCLDWGLGHVTRSVDIIRELQKNQNIILFCGTEFQISCIQQWLPDLDTFVLQQRTIQFKGDNRFNREAMRNVLNVFRQTKQLQKEVQNLCVHFQPDILISDHVYAFHSETIPSILITHQVSLPASTPYWIKAIHHQFLKKFNFLWVVDSPDLKLAGLLSDLTKNASYIGIRSRFISTNGNQENSHPNYGVLLLSGPEVYANQILKLFPEKYQFRFVLISPYDVPKTVSNHFHAVIKATDKQADSWIQCCSILVSRNGYSTLMDLVRLDKQAILIPTKGQHEQEYLATRTIDKVCYATNQQELEQILSAFISL